MREVFIEYPSRGTTYFREEFGVYEYTKYPASSVLAGQDRRCFLGRYDTLEEAKKAHPEAEYVEGSLFTPPVLDHLPDDGDY